HVELWPSTVVEEQVSDLAAAHVGGPLQRRRSPRGFCADVRAGCDQCFGKPSMVLLRSPVQRRLVVLTLGIDKLGIGSEELRAFLYVALLCGRQDFTARSHGFILRSARRSVNRQVVDTTYPPTIRRGARCL